MMKNFSPVHSHIPTDFAWRINFDGDNLADRAALNEDDYRANSSITTATLITPLDINGENRIFISDV
jgi:hypothetical protein